MKTKTALLSVLMMGAALVSWAQSDSHPVARTFAFDNNAWLTALSANGQYAIYTQYMDENTMFNVDPKLIDLSKPGNEGVIEINKTEAKNPDAARVEAVSDDGLCVGSYVPSGGEKELPAYWTQATGWKALPFPEGKWEGALVSDVTADGRYACGKVFNNGGMYEIGVLWDVANGTIIETPGLPKFNLAGQKVDMIRLLRISDDGKKIIGVADFAYPQVNYTFLYDVDTHEYVALGYDKAENDYTAEFTPLHPWIQKTEDGVVSSNGKYAMVDAFMTTAGQVFCPLVYDIENGTYTWYDDEDSLDMKSMGITDDGVPFVGAPYSSPIRLWSVRSNGYWVTFEEILRQKFNTDINKLTGYSDVTSGTIMGMSRDGKTLGCLVMDQTGESYVVNMPVRADVLAADINLLSEYSSSPREGSYISSLPNVSVTFTRKIEVLGANSCVKIVDGEGNEVKSSLKFVGNSADESVVDISFRNPQFEGGKDYYVVIPAGAICVKGDKGRVNEEIRLEFKGREAGPVKMVGTTPSAGTSLAEFNMTTAPIKVQFDTNIKTTNAASGAVYVVYDEDDEELLSQLGMVASQNELVVYPFDAQYFYADHKYKLVINAGSVTDLIGENPNETFEVTYNGIYEPEISSSYKNDFNDESWLTEFLFYEGDHNQPNMEMQGWGFLDGDSYPWWVVRDDNEYDWALTSHSMYSPSGQSNDWAILKQKFIADDQYTTSLIFTAQSYRKSAKDVLKVIVLESENPVTTVSDAFIQNFIEKGEVVFEKQLSPGATEGKLGGEWTEYIVNLDKYKGKYVYIAFVNDNKAQSAIFINEVELRHNVDLTLGIDNQSTLVAAEDVTIKGRVRVDNATKTYSELTFTLLNDKREKVDEIQYKGAPLKLNDVYAYSFNKPLPLEKGRENLFYVQVSGGDSRTEAEGVIANLYFQPEKRVVLEEQTGQGCTHCPLGHAIIDRLKESFGNRFIAVALHTYSGDGLGRGLESYSNYLNFGGTAPLATVMRNGRNVAPMQSTANGYTYTNPNDPLWWDDVVSELNSGTILNVDYKLEDGEGECYIDADRDMIVFPATVSFALDAEKLNLNVFSVLLEDKVIGKQANGHYAENDPLLGEWGAGGKYGRANISNFKFEDVARAYAGVTFNGTAGIIPSKVRAGREYDAYMFMNVPTNIADVENLRGVTMITDGVTGKVLNAVVGKVVSRDLSSVNSVAPDSANVDAYVADGKVVVVAGAKTVAKVYAIDGSLLAAGNGSGTFRVDTSGYKGVAIVNLQSEGKAKNVKVYIK